MCLQSVTAFFYLLFSGRTTDALSKFLQLDDIHSEEWIKENVNDPARQFIMVLYNLAEYLFVSQNHKTISSYFHWSADAISSYFHWGTDAEDAKTQPGVLQY